MILAAAGAGSSSAAGGARSRLGITVSRKVGNAVVRNRLKRRIREWFRSERDRLREPLDLVVIARPQAAALSGTELRAQLSKQLEKLERTGVHARAARA